MPHQFQNLVITDAYIAKAITLYYFYKALI